MVVCKENVRKRIVVIMERMFLNNILKGEYMEERLDLCQKGINDKKVGLAKREREQKGWKITKK